MDPPAKRYLSRVNRSFRNFPNRDELLLRKVLALPNDSKIGEVSKTFWSRVVTPAAER